MSFHDISSVIFQVVEARRAAAPPPTGINGAMSGLRWRGLSAELLAYAAYRYAETMSAPYEGELALAADVIIARYGLSSGSTHTLKVTPTTFGSVRDDVLSKMPDLEEALSDDEGCPIHPEDI